MDIEPLKITACVLTQGQLEAHTVLLHDGQATSFDPLAMHYIRLAKGVAGKQTKSYWEYKRDEILSVAFEQMLQALNRIYSNDISEFKSDMTPFVYSCVNNGVRNFLSEDNVIKTPRSLGKIPSQTVVSIDDHLQIIDEHAIIDLSFEDICSLVEASPLERRILELRSMGFTIEEISIVTELNRGYVYRTLMNLQELYLEKKDD